MASTIEVSAPPYWQHIQEKRPVVGNVVGDNEVILEVEALPPGAPSWTAAKTKRVALYIFAAVCVIGGVALIGLSVTGVIPAPYGYLAVPLFLLAITSVCVASQILDYEDPVELQAMKDEAPYLTYPQLVYKHGLANIERYDIISLTDQRDKFFIYARTLNFRSFSREMNIGDLEQYQILTEVEDLRVLRDLKMRLEDGRSNLSQITTDLDSKYPHRLNRRLKSLEFQEQNARAAYILRIEKCENTWNETIQREISAISRDNRDYQVIVARIRSAREAEKVQAVARVNQDAQNTLNSTLNSIQIERERISTDSIAIAQQTSHDQELELARRENSTAIASIEAAFTEWLNKSR